MTRINAKEVLKLLEMHYPNAKCELVFNSPFELLVATILSAQCTDERVNKVTPELFRHYPTVDSLANSDIEELKEIIRTTGFFNNKAKNIQGAAKMIVTHYNDIVPDSMVELIKLPGVARKTANVVLYNALGKNEGIAVDTHVIRVSNVIGLTNSKEPKVIEKELMKQFPQDRWGFLSQSLVLYGRYICVARKHDQSECFLGHYAM